MIDASRVVGVVADLLDDERRAKLDRANREEQERLRQLHADREAQPLLPYRIAVERRTPITWRDEDLPAPPFTGTRVLEPDLATLRGYIDWTFFFTAWELKGRYPQILDHPKHGAAARELFDNANELLDRIVADGSLTARAVYGYWPAHAEGDDLVLETGARFPMLRQQADHGDDRPSRSLADFVAPADTGLGGPPRRVRLHGGDRRRRARADVRGRARRLLRDHREGARRPARGSDPPSGSTRPSAASGTRPAHGARARS